jgi:hypothetical protein
MITTIALGRDGALPAQFAEPGGDVFGMLGGVFYLP